MKIRILTLTGQRDKHIDDILKAELIKRGHDCEIRSYIYAGRETVVYEKPDVVIHPMVGGEYKLDFVKKCKQWGVEVIVRRGEAGMNKKGFVGLSETRRKLIMGNWDYSGYVDLELVWGQEFACMLTDYRPYMAKQTHACGAFAFDPYFQPGFSRNTNRAGRKAKTILFATGFSAADCNVDHCELGIEEGNPYHNEISTIHRGTRDAWIDMINKMVERFDDSWAYELKVRPGEMTTEYAASLSPLVKIHPQGSSSAEVLRNCDILIHSGSTMAIEAHLMNIPSFNYWNVNPDLLLASVSPMCSDYTDLEFRVQRANIYNSTANEFILKELQQHLYGKIDGQACYRAAEKICAHIGNMKPCEVTAPNKWPKELLYPTDNVHTEKQNGDAQWLCPCCREVYFGEAYGTKKCPWCGMNIKMMKGETASVLK